MIPDPDAIPNWGVWRSFPTVSLFEATALSLAVEPRYLRPHVAGYRGGGIAVLGVPPDGDEFLRRLELAQRCIGETLPAAKPRDGVPHVRLGQFVTWARGLGWSLAPELLASASGASETKTTGGGPGNLRAAVSATIAELGQPGRDIPWKTFSDSVRSRCGVAPNTRGYGDRSIRRAVATIPTRQGATSAQR